MLLSDTEPNRERRPWQCSPLYTMLAHHAHPGDRSPVSDCRRRKCAALLLEVIDLQVPRKLIGGNSDGLREVEMEESLENLHPLRVNQCSD